MRKKVLLGVLTTLCVMVAYTQSAIYYPNIKTLKPSAETGLLEPESFVLLLEYPQGQPSYNIEDIDLLDSVYRVAFSRTKDPARLGISTKIPSSSFPSRRSTPSTTLATPAYFVNR